MKKFLRRIAALFTDRQVWVRQVAVAAIAAGVAWQVGDLVIKNGGVVAAIICSLSIRISLYKSVREGFGQIVGTAIGAGVALLSVWAFGVGLISVGLTVILCSVVARGLHLGEVASVNVPVTALIVIGPGLSQSTAANRLLSTLIGAGIAIVFSYFSHAKTPAGRTIDQISTLATKSAKLLAEMSEGVAAGFSQEDAGNWLAKGRLLIEEIPKVRTQSLEAKAHARWFPTADEELAEELYTRGVAIEHTVVQVRTIARTLFDAAVDGGIPYGIQRQIAQGLSASYAISSKADGFGDLESNLDQADELRLAGQTLAEQLIEESDNVDHEQLARSISLVTNLERIADSLDESSPALRDVETPDEPAANRVMKISPIDQTTKLSRRISHPVIKVFKKYF